MGKGRNKQLVTKRLQRITKQVTKPKGKNGSIGKITDSNRQISKTASHLRDRATIKRLKMYNDRPTRDKTGKILTQRYMSKKTENPVTRIAPDRRWFGNTKVISQKQLQLFRNEMSKNINDPFKVVLKSKKIPYGLLNTNNFKQKRMHRLEVESFSDTFGNKQKRKKPKLLSNNLESFINRCKIAENEYNNITNNGINDKNTIENKFIKNSSFGNVGKCKDYVSPIFLSGQSQRIKNELYKVIDSSDVLLQILDVRDPMGTRSPHIEKYLKMQCKHKHLVFILNKVDLVPTWVTQRWLKILSAEYPTIAFKASMNNSFGKGALISLLRQFRLLHKTRRTLSVGMIGYPNVGKSSLINTLVNKKSCNVAPIPGETKVWQYVSLFDKFYLIDCPGVVYPRPGDNDETQLLRSVVRIEQIESPEEYVNCVITRVRKEYLQKTYEIESWTDSDDFMRQLSKKRGKLLSGGEPDYHNIAVMILHDWQRGRLPWFVTPPFEDDLEFEQRLREAEDEINKEKEKFNLGDMNYEPILMNHVSKVKLNENNENANDKNDRNENENENSNDSVTTKNKNKNKNKDINMGNNNNNNGNKTTIKINNNVTIPGINEELNENENEIEKEHDLTLAHDFIETDANFGDFVKDQLLNNPKYKKKKKKSNKKNNKENKDKTKTKSNNDDIDMNEDNENDNENGNENENDSEDENGSDNENENENESENESESDDIDEYKEYMPKNDKEQKEFDNIKVSNPFNLSKNDPLILQARLRIWKERKYNKK